MKRFGPRHAAILVVAVGLFVAVNLAIEPRHRAQQTRNCQTNLKLIGLAMMQYARDYDEEFPVAARWMDDLKPYVFGRHYQDTDQAFHCPKTGQFYAFNRFYAQLDMAQDDNPTDSPLAFDVNLGTRNLSDDGSLWPNSPLHNWGQRWGNNVLFGDAHVKLTKDKPQFRAFADPTPKSKPKQVKP